jgi:flagellar biosynthetic protein FlhB
MMAILFAMAGGLVIIAGIDLPIQIVRLLRQLRMSKQEIKDEHKESEGSPEVKAQQRQRARAMAQRSVRKVVSEAHVVLTNPTHFAVALRYDRGKDNVPVVVAKGRGATALAIRDVAGEAKVPVLEYPALARAIYYTSRENQEVRDDLYMAIATVLAFVFNLNAQAGGSPPPIDVPDTARFDENGVKH